MVGNIQSASEESYEKLAMLRRPRWGEGMTDDEMKKCVWVKPQLVAQLEFLEWTDADHLMHSKFVGLREDKDARSVSKSKLDFPTNEFVQVFCIFAD